MNMAEQLLNLRERYSRLEFAFENLRRICAGEGGTAKIDQETGIPIVCECGQMIYHDHACKTLKKSDEV